MTEMESAGKGIFYRLFYTPQIAATARNSTLVFHVGMPDTWQGPKCLSCLWLPFCTLARSWIGNSIYRTWTDTLIWEAYVTIRGLTSCTTMLPPKLFLGQWESYFYFTLYLKLAYQVLALSILLLELTRWKHHVGIPLKLVSLKSLGNSIYICYFCVGDPSTWLEYLSPRACVIRKLLL